jgi:hypothetical protein
VGFARPPRSAYCTRDRTENQARAPPFPGQVPNQMAPKMVVLRELSDRVDCMSKVAGFPSRSLAQELEELNQ